MDSTIGQVCFSCYFLEGSQSKGCYIEYKCIYTDYNGNITIERKPADARNATNYAKGIYTGIYNVTFYDLDESNESYLNEYALKLTHQLVSGLPVPAQTSTSYIYLTTLTTLSSSLSPPSPTETCTNCTNSKTLCQNHINSACTFPTTVNNSISLVTGMLTYYCKNMYCISNSFHRGPSACFYCFYCYNNVHSICDVIKTEIQKDSK